MFSVVIPTIGRSTLNNAIDSVLREAQQCIVVNDGIDMPEPTPRPNLKYIKLGRNFGRLDGVVWYGQVAFTVGTYLSQTEFTMAIGDDDELLHGAGELINRKIAERPEVDIWVPGIVFNNGNVLCTARNVLMCGNVSHTLYRSKILATEPMYHRKGENTSIHDWLHVERCVQNGWSIDWIEAMCVAIRPHLPGTNGRGAMA